ncbi:MAG: hypothetical protein ABSG84_01040 [Acidobacteriaceae bacterium]|jgi:hypothetical protein
MRRRILAITLLIAFGSPLVAPLLAATADPEASLPPCCRSHGMHHCAMMHRMLMASSGPVFSAPPCPFYPTPATPVRTATASLAAPAHLSVAQLRSFARLAATPRRVARTFAPSANLKRGPPTIA